MKSYRIVPNQHSGLCDHCKTRKATIKLPLMGWTALICEECAKAIKDPRGNKVDLSNKI